MGSLQKVLGADNCRYRSKENQFLQLLRCSENDITHEMVMTAIATMNSSQDSVDPELREKILSLATGFEASRSWDFEKMNQLLVDLPVSDFPFLITFIESFSNFTDIGRFLLWPGVDSLMVHKLQDKFSDCPHATLAFLEFLKHVFYSWGDAHQDLLALEFYSFPLDILQQISGDILIFVEDIDRSDLECEIACRCLDVISGFYEFHSFLVEEQVRETCMAFLGNWCSDNPRIRMSAVRGLENAMTKHLMFVLKTQSMDDLADGIVRLLHDPSEDIQVHALRICRHVASFPDKRYAYRLLSRGVLDLSLTDRCDAFLEAVFAIMYEFVPHDGELVEITLKSQGALDGIEYLHDQSYLVTHAAFLFYSRILRYPQAVHFVIEHPNLIIRLCEIVEDADSDIIELFLSGFESFLAFCNEMAIVIDTGLVVQTLHDITQRTDVPDVDIARAMSMASQYGTFTS